MPKSSPIGTLKFATQTLQLADGLLRFDRQTTMYQVFTDYDGLQKVAEVDISDVIAEGDTGVPTWYDQDEEAIDFSTCFVKRRNATKEADLANNSVVINGGKRVYIGNIVYRVMKGQIKQEVIIRHNGKLKAINPDACKFYKRGGRVIHAEPIFTRGLGAGIVIKTDDSEVLTLGHVSQMYDTYKAAAAVAGFDPEMSSVRNGRLQGVTLYQYGGRSSKTISDLVGTVEQVKRLAAA